MRFFNKDSKCKQDKAIDPSEFVEIARDSNGLVIAEEEKREKTERRDSHEDNRSTIKRRRNSGFSWRNLFFLSRRSAERRDKKKTRRYGLDRRMLKPLTEDEQEMVKNAQRYMAYTDKTLPKAEDVVPAETILAGIAAKNQAKAQEESKGVVRSSSYEGGQDRVLIEDAEGNLLAKVFRKAAEHDAPGNNQVQICGGQNKGVVIECETDGGAIYFRGQAPQSLGLTCACDEIVHVMVGAKTTIMLNDKTQRVLNLMSFKGIDSQEDDMVHLAKKTQQLYFPVLLQLRGVGQDIEYISDKQIRFASVRLLFDGKQIIDVVDESGVEFRLTGIAGERNLQEYLANML